MEMAHSFLCALFYSQPLSCLHPYSDFGPSYASSAHLCPYPYQDSGCGFVDDDFESRHNHLSENISCHVWMNDGLHHDHVRHTVYVEKVNASESALA